jgi:hypothetical protein
LVIDHCNMRLFKVFEESVQILEVKSTASIVAAEVISRRRLFSADRTNDTIVLVLVRGRERSIRQLVFISIEGAHKRSGAACHVETMSE